MPLRFVLDENVPVDLARELARLGHDAVVLPRELRAADDTEVLAHAVRDARILVTLDTDFGTLIFVRRQPAPPAVVLIRLRPAELIEKLAAVAAVIEAAAGEQGAFIVVDAQGVRTRPLPEA